MAQASGAASEHDNVAATDTRDATESDGEEYRGIVVEALAEYERGHWSEAATLFERAHQLNPSARTWRGLGLTAFEDRRYVNAIEFLTRALDDKRHALTEKQRGEVSKTLTRARRFVGHVVIRVETQGAHVAINGRPAEPDGEGEFLADPGVVEVEVSADGYETATRRVRVDGSSRAQLHVTLRRNSSAIVSAVTTSPAASERAGESAPFATLQPSAATPAADAGSGVTALGVAKWVTAGATIAGLVVSSLLLAQQKSTASDYNEACLQVYSEACARKRRAIEGPYTSAPIVGFSVTGALAAAAGVLFVLDATRDDKHETVRAACGVGAAEIGLQCRVMF
jgi:tetratricopeptide (TPR) repeat protein